MLAQTQNRRNRALLGACMLPCCHGEGSSTQHVRAYNGRPTALWTNVPHSHRPRFSRYSPCASLSSPFSFSSSSSTSHCRYPCPWVSALGSSSAPSQRPLVLRLVGRPRPRHQLLLCDLRHAKNESDGRRNRLLTSRQRDQANCEEQTASVSVASSDPPPFPFAAVICPSEYTRSCQGGNLSTAARPLHLQQR